MADPVRFVPSYDFSDFEETQPNTPKPGVQLDAQFDDISASTTSLRDAIRDIRRSDGALVNGIVTEDSLADGLLDVLEGVANADLVAQSAVEAADSAAVAVEARDEAVGAATALDSAVEALSALGYFFDWGSITEDVGSTTDYGTLV